MIWRLSRQIIDNQIALVNSKNRVSQFPLLTRRISKKSQWLGCPLDCCRRKRLASGPLVDIFSRCVRSFFSIVINQSATSIHSFGQQSNVGKVSDWIKKLCCDWFSYPPIQMQICWIGLSVYSLYDWSTNFKIQSDPMFQKIIQTLSYATGLEKYNIK